MADNARKAVIYPVHPSVHGIPERRAWTGGDTPQRAVVLADTPTGRLYRYVRRVFFWEQLRDWRSFWGDMPNLDTARIFWTRASLDAWRTLTDSQGAER